jgi:tRNA/rRNA methyltransferase
MIVGTSSASGRSSPHVQRMLPDASHMIRTHLEKSQAALVLGSEKFGLSNDDLSHCDWIVSIRHAVAGFSALRNGSQSSSQSVMGRTAAWSKAGSRLMRVPGRSKL